MRSLASVVLLTALTATACKDKKVDKPADKAPPAATGATGAAPRPVISQDDLTSPTDTFGSDPIPTELPSPTAPAPQELLESLKTWSPAGFAQSPRTRLHATDIVTVVVTTKRPKIQVDTQIGACGGDNECLPMELAAWKAKEKEVETKITGPDLLADPGTEVSLDADTVAGKTVIGMRLLALKTSTSGAGGGSFANAWIIYYNDGVNFARIAVSYADDMADKENMQKMVPLPVLKKLASEALLVYWNKLPKA